MISTIISGPIQFIVATMTTNDWACLVGSLVCLTIFVKLYIYANK